VVEGYYGGRAKKTGGGGGFWVEEAREKEGGKFVSRVWFFFT